MEEPSWWIYLKTVARTEDGVTIADAAGVTPPQVSRWKTGKNRPDADKLARFARKYQRPPVEALVAAGYLTVEEAAEVIEIHRGADALTDEELLAEVQRRMKGMRNALEAAAATGTSIETRRPEEAGLHDPKGGEPGILPRGIADDGPPGEFRGERGDEQTD